MQEFWDKRYSEKEYAYGESPNQFFMNEIQNLEPGTLLLPAEGEGRNAVFAAGIGWNVTAFDYSINAIQKAINLAKKKNVNFEYLHRNFDSLKLIDEHFDCIALTFVHPPAEKRCSIHRNLLNYLKIGGKLILEGFSKKQIDKNSGGPKNKEMLFSKEEIARDFEQLKDIKISEEEIILQEGIYHRGPASVIRLTGIK